ncbi:MAG: TRAP transporter small permease [Rhodobacteraceae bacterium]|nr:TRAP transporter small permease [Paracoccaceae bacterium]TVR49774.1 MAG: TRAP transporter small permease [Paracoccaceae bacterium]
MRMMIAFTVWLCRALALLGGAAVVLMMFHVTLDVALLNLFRISMNTTPEIVARYYMVAVAFLPLGWLTLRNQMISVELLDYVLPASLRRGSDVLIALIGVGVYGILTYATWVKALREMRSGTFVELVRFQMPVWHSYFIVPAGFALATLACALLAVILLVPSARAELTARTEDDAE